MVGAVVAAGVDEPGGLEVEEPAMVVLVVLVAPDFSAADMVFVHGSGITFRLVLILPGVANCCTVFPCRYGAMNVCQTFPATVPP